MNININLTDANLPDVDLTKTICRLFADELAIEIPETDTDLVQCGLLDSLTLVDLLVHLERSETLLYRVALFGVATDLTLELL